MDAVRPEKSLRIGTVRGPGRPASGHEFARTTIERLERAGFEVFVTDTVAETLALIE